MLASCLHKEKNNHQLTVRETKTDLTASRFFRLSLTTSPPTQYFKTCVSWVGSRQFRSDAPIHPAAIQQAIGPGDSEALATAAHTLKGSCQAMGAAPLRERCFDLEQKG